jgi:hypothetical protein
LALPNGPAKRQVREREPKSYFLHFSCIRLRRVPTCMADLNFQQWQK